MQLVLNHSWYFIVNLYYLDKSYYFDRITIKIIDNELHNLKGASELKARRALEGEKMENKETLEKMAKDNFLAAEIQLEDAISELCTAFCMLKGANELAKKSADKPQ